VAAVVALAALAAGCAVAPCDDRHPARVQFLSANDVYQLEPDREGRGGLARLATLVRERRAATPWTLFVLAGDTLSPSLHSALFRGRQMIEAWNALGLDAATFGNHEFDWGPEVLRERMAESRFPWLSANVLEAATGRPWGGARRGLVREWGGLRVGLVGLTLPETAVTSSPGPAIRFAPPAPSAEEALQALEPLHLRAAVTHLELHQDRLLARAVPLHVVLGGHDHDPMVHEEGPTLILKAGSDAVNLGQVEFDLGCGGAVLGRRHRLIPVDAGVPAAADVAALVARWREQAERELDVVVTRLPAPVDARESRLRREPAPLGQFLAALMRERVGAQVGLLNAGAVRSREILPAGPLTRRDLRRLLPFDNVVVLLEVEGAALLEALEHAAGRLPRPAGAYLQTAGLDWEVDAGRAAGQRVVAAAVGGRPVDPAGRYRVAVPDYLARGGDGYVMLGRQRVLVPPESGPPLFDLVLEALGRGRLP
jgi:5'-nucleotidase